ncbi:MAG: hypothetical protein JNJ49_01910 [Bdellovibrionaceae bacterium]|nr:hypothetical protein [Pseudobdellovibrionaceae bacterium]
MRTAKSNCPLVRSQNRQATAPALAISKLVLAFALGLMAFGGGLSVAVSVSDVDRPQLRAQSETPSQPETSHYVASLPTDDTESASN